MKRTRRSAISLATVFVIVLTLAVQLFIFSSGAEGSAKYDTSIMNVKGGANAIATMTFDDGVYANDSLIEEMVSEYGLSATLMVVPERIINRSGYSKLGELQAMIDNGSTDVQSHSYSHMYIAPEGHADYSAANNTDGNRYREIVGSRDFLATALENTDQLAFAVPGGTYDEEAMSLVMRTYYSARTHMGASADSIQSLTPAEGQGEGGWYGIKSLWLSAGLDTVCEYLDACVDQGGWFFTGAHNIVESNSMWDMTPEDFGVLLSKMKQYSDDGKLWVATYSDAVKYLREYESAAVTHTAGTNGTYISVTMADTTPDGLPLDPSVFNMPLTVKAEIPEGWASVRLVRGNESKTVESFIEGGKTYILFDAVPNGGAYLLTNAAESLATPQSLSATFSSAYGGASSIATMTFDDGGISTAYELKSLCATYDCAASLMLIPSSNFLASDGTQKESAVKMWQTLFEGGLLSPESHSLTHAYLDGSVAANLTEAKYESEVAGSLTALRTAFPEHDVLTFALPYSSYVDGAYDVVMQNYYAARSGICVLYNTSYQGRMQSLDPAHSREAGGWYNPIGIRLMPEQGYTGITLDKIIDYLDTCVANGGWFISMAHGLVESENYDISPTDLAALMSRMQGYSREGKLWVATYTDATKYVRERQNSTVTAVAADRFNYTVSVTMADQTAEGLSLDPDIFDMPLTVKLEIPAGGRAVRYSAPGGDDLTVPTFVEDGITYAYIDVVPNSGNVSVCVADGEARAHSDGQVGDYTAPATAWRPTSSGITYATFASEDDYINGADCIGAYEGDTIDTANITASGVGYVQLFAHLSVGTVTPTSHLTIGLGGYSLTMKGLKITTTDVALTLKDGTVINTGSISTRAKSKLLTDNVYFLHNTAQFGASPATSLWHFKDSVIELAAEESYFAFGHYNLVNAEGKILFENTDILITGSVHSEQGLFHFMGYQNANAGTSHYRVVLDKDSAVIGDVPIFATCYEKQYGTNYYGFGTPAYVSIEHGCTFSKGARPDFTYYFYDMDNTTGEFISYTQRDADDGILKIQIVVPGTTDAIPGDPSFAPSDSGYTATVINSPAGTYIEPVGAYKPASDVTFALWTTEGEYLAGLEPLASWKVSTIDATVADELAYGGYVHFFSDVTLGATFTPNEKTPVIFDLGGNTFTCNAATKLDAIASSLTVRNGVFDCTKKNNLTVRRSSLVFENVHFKTEGTTVGYANSALLFKFKDCLLELCGTETYFSFGYYNYDDVKLVFENSDIVIKGSINSTYGLFYMREDLANNPYNGITVLLDKDSSITGSISCLATFVHTTKLGDQYVYIELGFTLSENKDVSTLSQQYNSSTAEVGESEYLHVLVVYPGTATEVGRYTLIEREDGLFSYAELVVSYATYKSEEAYLAGDEPIGEFFGDITAESILAEGVGYVVILSEHAISSDALLAVANGRAIVIDLCGGTLKSSAGFSIDNGSSLTLKNGTLTLSGGGITAGVGATVILDSVSLDVFYAGAPITSDAAALIALRGCTVTLASSANSFILSGADGVSSVFELDSTTVEVNADLVDALIAVSAGMGVEVRIDGSSAIKGSGSAPAPIGVPGGTDGAVKVYIGNGFTFIDGMQDTVRGYLAEDGYRLSDSVCTVYLGGIDMSEDKPIFLTKDATDGYCTVSRKAESEDYIFFRLDSSGGFYTGVAPSSYAEGYPVFTQANLQSLSANEVIYFAQDFIVNTKTAPSGSQSKTDFVFDLGGHTFYLRGQMNLTTTAIHYSFTYRNGVIDATQAGSFSGNPNADGSSIFAFENVTINYSGTGQFFNTYAGTLVLKDSAFNGANGYLVSFDAADRFFTVQISGSTVTAKRVIRSMRINSVSKLDYDKFFIKDSVVNVSDCLMEVLNAQSPTAENYIRLDISGSSITAPGIMQVSANTVGSAIVRLSSTRLANAVAIKVGTVTGSGTDSFRVIVADGQVMMQTEGIEGYAYLADRAPLASGELTVNLTLYSDFTLNFFADPDRVKSILLSGVELVGSKYGDSMKYAVSGITPDTAAEDLSFTVVIEKDGVTYTVPLAYSVLTYASAVMKADVSDGAKQMVSAAMDYVKAAYSYVGNDPFTFEGCEYAKVENDATEVTDITDAIVGVRFALDTSFKLRFRIAEGYEGPLYVNDYSYYVIDGKIGAVDYVEVELRAYQLPSSVIISDGDETVLFGLANYANSASVEENTELKALVDALYTFGVYARSYRASNPDLS